MTKPALVLMILTALGAVYCLTTGEYLEAAAVALVVYLQYGLVKAGF